MPHKVSPNWGHKLYKNGQDIPFETFLGFDGYEVPDLLENFSGEDQPSAHGCVRDLFGEICALCGNSWYGICQDSAYGFVKGYERDYGKLSCDASRTPRS